MNSNKKVLTFEEFSDMLKKENIHNLIPLKKDENLFQVQCPVCNYIFSRESYYFLKRKRGCPNCRGSHKKTTEEFKEDVKNLVGNEYSVLGEYENNKEKILMKHNICGNEYLVSPNKFFLGRRCPKCSHRKY